MNQNDTYEICIERQQPYPGNCPRPTVKIHLILGIIAQFFFNRAT